MKVRNPYSKKLLEANKKGDIVEINNIRQLWLEYNREWLRKNEGSLRKINRDLRILHREKEDKEFKRSKRKIYDDAVKLYRKSEKVMLDIRQFKKEMREIK